MDQPAVCHGGASAEAQLQVRTGPACGQSWVLGEGHVTPGKHINLLTPAFLNCDMGIVRQGCCKNKRT